MYVVSKGQVIKCAGIKPEDKGFYSYTSELGEFGVVENYRVHRTKESADKCLEQLYKYGQITIHSDYDGGEL